MRIAILLMVMTTLAQTNQCYGSKILGLFLFQGKSHHVMFEALMRGLAERGHTVDVVSHFPPREIAPRYNDLSIRGMVPMYVNNISVESALEMSDAWGTISFIADRAGLDLCTKFFDLPLSDDLLKKSKNNYYDLVITELFGADCSLVFSNNGKIPTVAVTSSYALPWGNTQFGNVDNPAYISNYFYKMNDVTNFWDRLANTASLVFSKLLYEYMSTRPINQFLQETFKNSVLSLESLNQNISLVLVNSHFSTHKARPLAPNVKEVAGLHIPPLKKLLPHIETVANNSNKGIIYFTLGSMIRTETFPLEKKQALIDAFAEFPEYTVFWKAEREMFPKQLPKNIHFERWLPQLDLLCHPKTKVFITHGGLMGSQEAIQCGVPLIGMPFFGDQEMNLDNFVDHGTAIKLDFHTLTKESIVSALKEVLMNSNYKHRSVSLSKLFRDRPLTALDESIYWVEYVIEHKGAPHLRPERTKLAWYQIYLLDIALFVISILVIGIVITILGLFKIYRKYCKMETKLKIN